MEVDEEVAEKLKEDLQKEDPQLQQMDEMHSEFQLEDGETDRGLYSRRLGEQHKLGLDLRIHMVVESVG